MKNFKLVLVAALTAIMAVGCVGTDDTSLPHYEILPLSQGFDRDVNYNALRDNTLLEIPGWYNFAQTGSALWKIQVYQGNGYAELTTFQSGDAVNVSWLVSPEFIPEEKHSTLVFRVAQSYVLMLTTNLRYLYLKILTVPMWLQLHGFL